MEGVESDSYVFGMLMLYTKCKYVQCCNCYFTAHVEKVLTVIGETVLRTSFCFPSIVTSSYTGALTLRCDVRVKVR